MSELKIGGSIPALTGLRAVGALLVICYHLYAHMDWFLQPIMSLGGYLGVALFFSLSGYILCHVYGRLAGSRSVRDWGDYLIRRVARLYPLHIFMIGVLLIVFPSWASEANALDLFSHLTLTQAWWNERLVLVGASWSISVEFFYYLLFPVLLGLRHRHRALITFLAIATLHALISSGSLADTWIGELLARRILNYGAFFVLGMCTYFMAIQYEWLRRLTDGDLPFVAFALAIVSACYVPETLEVAVVLALPLIVRSTHTSRFAAITLGNPVLIFLGEISYALYLSHQIVYGFMQLYAPEVPALLAILVFSALCHFLVERPSREWARRILARKQTRPIYRS